MNSFKFQLLVSATAPRESAAIAGSDKMEGIPQHSKSSESNPFTSFLSIHCFFQLIISSSSAGCSSKEGQFASLCKLNCPKCPSFPKLPFPAGTSFGIFPICRFGCLRIGRQSGAVKAQGVAQYGETKARHPETLFPPTC